MVTLSLIAVMAAITLPSLGRAREAVLRTYCMNNMRELGRIFTLFAGDHKGMFPPGHPNHVWGEYVTDVTERTQRYRNNYTVDPRSLIGYLPDYRVFVCRSARHSFEYDWDWWFTDVTLTDRHVDPAVASQPPYAENPLKYRIPRPDPECLTNQMYFYLPYAVGTEGQFLFLMNELDNRMDRGLIDFMREDLPSSEGPQGPGGSDVFFRLRDGVERMFITDVANAAASYRSQSEVPVLFDKSSLEGRYFWNHIVSPGGNVLYMDGSVQFVRFEERNGEIPYTPDIVEWLRKNTYNNHSLGGVPPWCANRQPGVPFEPRYKYYPSDSMYDDLAL